MTKEWLIDVLRDTADKLEADALEIGNFGAAHRKLTIEETTASWLAWYIHERFQERVSALDALDQVIQSANEALQRMRGRRPL